MGIEWKKKFKDLVFKYIWKGCRKIPKELIRNPREFCGLRLVDFQARENELKILWVLHSLEHPFFREYILKSHLILACYSGNAIYMHKMSHVLSPTQGFGRMFYWHDVNIITNFPPTLEQSNPKLFG